MPKNDVIGLILAGGQARCMGGADKGFLKLGGKALIERAIAHARTAGRRTHHPYELLGQGLRKMDDFVARFPNARVIFPSAPIDPFFNINMLDDLARAEEILS